MLCLKKTRSSSEWRLLAAVRVLTVLAVLCIAASSCKQSSQPAASPAQPSLTVTPVFQSSFPDGSDVLHWSLTGRSVNAITLNLDLFEDGARRRLDRVSLSMPSQSGACDGEITVLISSSGRFGVENKQSGSIYAVVEGFSSKSSTAPEDVPVIEIPQARQTSLTMQTNIREMSPDPSSYTMLWRREHADPSIREFHGHFASPDDILEYTKAGRSMLVVSIQWEPLP